MDVKEQVIFLVEQGLLEKLCDRTPCPVQECDDCIMNMSPNKVLLKLEKESK